MNISTTYSELNFAFSCISKFIRNHGFEGCIVHEWKESDFEQFSFPELIHDSNGNSLVPGDLYAIVTCNNGYRYYINITGTSVLAACADVLEYIQHK